MLTLLATCGKHRSGYITAVTVADMQIRADLKSALINRTIKCSWPLSGSVTLFNDFTPPKFVFYLQTIIKDTKIKRVS